MGFDSFSPSALHDPADFRAFFPYTPNEVKHRKRTTSAQLKILENVFRTDTKPNASLRNELAIQLDMTARGVQVWFQNRRAKEKTKTVKGQRGPKTATSPPSPSFSPLALEDDFHPHDESPPSDSPIQLPDASLKPPQLHLVTSGTAWKNAPIEPPPDSAGYLDHRRSSFIDLHNYRRGSLPANAFPSSFSNAMESPSPGQWFDPMARRRSVDASLQRLADNPYADLARTKNTALFGPRFGMLPTPRHHSRVSISRRPPLNHLSSAPHVNNIRRSSMDARGLSLSLRTNALSPAPTNPPPYISSRSSLPDHRLFAVTSRVVGSPIPGPLPSPNFSFGAASTPPMASPSSADSDRNSPDSLRSFSYPGTNDHEDDGLSSPVFEAYSRFNSIASVATSESSVNSYYSDFGGDPLGSHDLHNASRRNSCSPGHFLDFGDLDGNGQYGLTTEVHYPNDDYGISCPQGITVPESVSNSYPSPASTISAGSSLNTLDAASVTIASSNIPISRTSELTFALQNNSEQARDQYVSSVQSDQQGDMSSNLTTTSSSEASTLSSSTVYRQEHDLGPGQYTYSSVSDCYSSDGQATMPVNITGPSTPVYNTYGDMKIGLDSTTGLQNVNVEAFATYA